MFVGKRQRHVDDCQQRENESLDRSDEKVEELDEDRNDGDAQRQIEESDADVRQDDRRDDDEEQLSDEDIEEQPRRKRDWPQDFVENVDGQKRWEGFEDMTEIGQAFLAKRNDLDRAEDDQRERQDRVEVGRRRSAERQTDCFKGQHPELVEQENEEKERHEKRDERLAALAQDAGDEIGDVVENRFEDRLTLANVRRTVARADPAEKDQRDDHDQPGRHDGVGVNRAEHRQSPLNMFADLFVHALLSEGSRRAPRVRSEREEETGQKRPERPPGAAGRERRGYYTKSGQAQ